MEFSGEAIGDWIKIGYESDLDQNIEKKTGTWAVCHDLWWLDMYNITLLQLYCRFQLSLIIKTDLLHTYLYS